MAILTTGDLNLPDQILDPWLGRVADLSVVSALSGQIPMKFGTGHSMTFDIGEAEFVGEGQNKGASEFTPTTQTVTPYKFHKTVRFTDEVKWADEDHQLQVIDQILAKIQPALARALDYGILHGINPATGAPVAAMSTKLSDTVNVVDATADGSYAFLDAADALVLADGFVPSDAALTPAFASRFSQARTDQGVKLYPDFTLGTTVSTLDGHRAAVSRTVSAEGVAATPTNILGFVGDFSAIQWGIQRNIGLHLIEYGDPDGQGDLQRNNQIAFRAEVVYGWGIADLNAFAKLTTTPAP